MKRIIGLLFVFFFPVLLCAGTAQFIVQVSPGQQAQVAADHGLTATAALPTQNIFLMVAPDGTSPQQVLSALQADPRVLKVEANPAAALPELSGPAQFNPSPAVNSVQPAAAAAGQSATQNGGFNSNPVSYFGTLVPAGYVYQPAAALLRLSKVQRTFQATGAGVVAVIDTGVDPNHAVLQSVLVPGYDFTRDTPGIPSELADLPPATAAILTQSTAAILDKNLVVVLNQSTAAILDQSTAAILDTSQLPAAFGHGTMVAGVVHLVAPTASIMPLKAFQVDGTANLFDIIRAIYFAVDNGADVINLSFNLVTNSSQFMAAVNYARAHGVTVVASVGNSATRDLVYPAGMKNVFGIASTDNQKKLSSFSNYGSSMVDFAAPGEGIVTTYPGNNYASAWGTSFSAPFVSGGAALLEQISPGVPQQEVLAAFSKGKHITVDMGFGCIDLLRAVQWLSKDVAQDSAPGD